MGVDPLSYVRPGQGAEEVILDAARHNAYTDAANYVRRMQRGPNAEGLLLPTAPGIINVRNDTGADRDRYSIVAFEEPVFTRDDNIYEFQENTLFKAIEPAWPDHFLSWGILLEPLAENKIGRCLVSGIGVAQVNFASADASTGHKYATVRNAEYGYLDSAPCGPAKIIAVEDAGTGTKWCKLWLGAPMPSGGKAKTPGGGLTARSGSGFPYTPGSGSCDVAKWSGSTYVDAGWNMTIYNDVDVAVGASLLIDFMFDEVGRPICVVEPCPA